MEESFFVSPPAAKVYVRALETARTDAFSFELVGYANVARESNNALSAQLEIELSSTRQVIWRLYNAARARDAKTIKSET